MERTYTHSTFISVSIEIQMTFPNWTASTLVIELLFRISFIPFIQCDKMNLKHKISQVTTIDSDSNDDNEQWTTSQTILIPRNKHFFIFNVYNEISFLPRVCFTHMNNDLVFSPSRYWRFCMFIHLPIPASFGRTLINKPQQNLNKTKISLWSSHPQCTSFQIQSFCFFFAVCTRAIL